MNIVSDIISIVTVSDGDEVKLATSQLQGLGADSLLIGGYSTTTDEGLLIESVANEITVEAGVQLDLPELVMVADSIDVNSDPGAVTRLQSSGEAVSESQRLIIAGDVSQGINGDAAVVSVSNRTLTMERAAPTGSGTGQLTISADSTLQANGSMIVDVAGDITFSGRLEAQDGLINLGATVVSLGETDGKGISSGLILSNEVLTGLNGSRLRLRADTSIDIYGEIFNSDDGTDMSFSELNLDSRGITGISNDNSDVQLVADQVILSSSTGNELAGVGAMANASALNVSADRINLDDGTFQVQGFDMVNLTAGSALLLTGSGELIAEGPLNIDTPVAAGTTGVEYTITAQGGKLSFTGGDPLASIPDSVGLAAALNLQGDAIDFAGRVALPSGQVTLNQLGDIGSPVSGNDIEISSGAIIDVAGITQEFGPETLVTGGGNIILLAETGDIRIADGSELNVSAGLDVSEAGGIQLKSENGQTSIASNTAFVADGSGGDFILDSDTLEAGGIDDALAYTELSKVLGDSFKDQRYMRLRSQGIEHGESLTVTAHHISLVSDSESVTIRGTIDASGQGMDTVYEDGGTIMIAAGDSVDIESTAVLLATGTQDDSGTPVVATSGGKVELVALDADADDVGASNDRVNLKAGAIIDVSGGSNENYSTDDRLIWADETLGGEVLVYTRLIDAATATFVQGELDATIKGAAKTDLVVTNKIEILDGDIDSVDITDFYNQTKTFMDNTVASVDGFRVAPGLHVWSASDLTLKDEWNFNSQTGRAANPGFPPFIPPTTEIAASPSWHFGETAIDDGVAGYLTLRTAGDLILEASITDAFYIDMGNAIFGIPDIEKLSDSTESWSYTIVAGASLSSADSLAVDTSNGNLQLTADLDIRTGTGDISIATGNNIEFIDPAAAIYTAGYNRGVSEDLDRDNLLTEIESRMYIWLGGGANFPVDGGDLYVKAGGDVVSASKPALPSEWQPRVGISEPGGNGVDITDDIGQIPANWGVAFNRYASGFGALGGGTLSLQVEGDVSNIVIAVPTTGRTVAGSELDTVSSKFVNADETTEVAGGGIMKVDIGGDADDVQYYLGDGVAGINIAGDSGNTEAGTGTEIYTGFDSQVMLVAGGELSLSTVTDFGTVDISDSQGSLTGNGGISGVQERDKDYYVGGYFTYSETNAVDLHALSGKVSLSSISDQALPPVFRLVSHSDDLVIDAKQIAQYPSAHGQIELIAANNIDIVTSSFQASTLTQAGYDASLLSNIQDSLLSAVIENNLGNVREPIHTADEEKSLIIARGGSISTTGSSFWKVELVEALYMQAGVDINNLSIKVQNNSENDITSFIAGRDIIQPTQRDNTGKFVSVNVSDSDSITQFEISGPGTVEFLAGRDIDLGTSDGIETVGNNKNRFLPDEGADLILMAGLGGDIDLTAFAETYLTERKVPVSVTLIEIGGNDLLTEDGSNVYTDGKSFLKDATSDPADEDSYLVALTGDEIVSLGLGDIDTSDGISIVDEVSGDLVTRNEIIDYSVQVSQYLEKRNIPVVNADPVATFKTLDDSEQRLLLTDLLFAELKDGGTYAKLSGSDDYSRGFDAITTLFPLNDPDGGISLLLSQVQTLDGGDIGILVPGGSINAGSSSSDIITKGVTDLGIFTALAGDVSIFVDQDLLVNASRVFSLEGDLLVWSSNGNIDAGKGAKTVTSLPSTNWELDASGNVILVTDPAVSGSGLQGTDVALFAPQGVVNAGDAGISARGDVILGAPQVLGADNIDVGGVSVGVPTASAGVGASVAGAGDATKSATDVAAQTTDFGTEDGGSTTLGILSVNVEGFGNSGVQAGPSTRPVSKSAGKPGKKQQEKEKKPAT